MIELCEAPLRTKFGQFREVLYYDGTKEVIVLACGDIGSGEDVICRVHSHCISAHVFYGVECDCLHQMEYAQQRILAEGRGVIVWLDQEGRGNGHLAKMLASRFRATLSQDDAYRQAGFRGDARDYQSAVAVLRHLGIRSVRLISDNPLKLAALSNGGIFVREVISTRVSS